MKKNSIRILSAVLAVCLCASCCHCNETYYNYVAIDSTDTPEDIVMKAAHVVPTARQLEWQKLELTAFAHFGINTFSDSQWGSGQEDPAIFNPVRFDARQWARVLSEAGFRSLILTCKHHDGFCLWPSAYTDYSVLSSPWKDGKGDVVREVSDACREYGLGFGIYLSPWDRHDHRYGTPEYNDYFVNQLTELLTGYGPVCEVWLDGACGEGPNGKVQEYDFDRWYSLVRRLQPDCVIAVMGPDVRWVGNERGIARESEWSVVPNGRLDPGLIAGASQHDLIVPPTRETRDKDLGSREVISGARTLVWYPAESDVSIRPGWFYSEAQDGRTKSAETLMDIYFSSVGRNSNLLLNIPPGRDGLFGEDEVRSLMEFAAMRREMFSCNLLEDAEVTVEGVSKNNSRAVCDGDYDTCISIEADGEVNKSRYVAWRWSEPKSFSVFMAQEDIRKGQRVESFSLEYKGNDSRWHTAASGTTIGYKRLLRFEPVTASEVRLVIKESRHTPVIAETGLY
ncbi:MAG: alpha-L-fucosidase [Candidatus Cryptobacteroides sp.]